MKALLPSSLDEALELLAAHPEAIPLAGGTDLLVHWPQQHDAHEHTYLDLSGVAELVAHRWTDEALVLGAMTTYWDVIQDERTPARFPMLIEAGSQVGSIQIQARGTWAGNIVNASPAADGVPVLMAYDAMLVLRDIDGEEEIPLADFYLDYKVMRRRPGQLITEIRIPRRAFEWQRFEKVGPRAAQAITKIGLAMAKRADAASDSSTVTDSSAGDEGVWRIVANSVAPTVRRCRAVEALLEAKTPVSGPGDLLPAIREDVSPIDDIRSTAEYRETVMARLLYYDLRGVCPFFS
jgi:CO/xanthine dehydrogenase FAD-binding subunit